MSFNVICEWFRQAAGPKCQPFYLLGQRNVSLYAEPPAAVDGLQRPWGHRDRQPFRPPWPRDDRLEQQQFNWFATWDILIFFALGFITVQWLNLAMYLDFGPIAQKRCQISPLRRKISWLFTVKRVKFKLSGQGRELAPFVDNGTQVKIPSEIRLHTFNSCASFQQYFAWIISSSKTETTLLIPYFFFCISRWYFCSHSSIRKSGLISK